jgi:hypothetical protein
MKNFKRFEVQGPFEALKKLPKNLIQQVKPIHFKIYGQTEGIGVVVALYEEFQKPNNISLSVCLIIEMVGNSMVVEVIESGGKQGFSGNYLSDYKTIYDTLTDFIVEYGKRHGLALLDKSDSAKTE